MLSIKRNHLLRVIKKGFLDILPLNLAVIPWGLLCGSLAIQHGFSVLEAVLMPTLVYAGAVQLVVTELIANNTPLLTILFTAFIISSRHFLYGLALREKFTNMAMPYRLGLGFLLTDELFALSGHRKAFQGKLRLLYGLSCGGFFYLSWLLWNIVGIVAGSYLPDLTSLGLDFAIAVTFIALVMPTVNNIPTLITVIVAAICAIIFRYYQWQLGLVASSIIAMFCGYLSCRYLALKKSTKAAHIRKS